MPPKTNTPNPRKSRKGGTNSNSNSNNNNTRNSNSNNTRNSQNNTQRTNTDSPFKNLIVFMMNNLNEAELEAYYDEAASPNSLAHDFPNCLLANPAAAAEHAIKWINRVTDVGNSFSIRAHRP